jgi:V/A-type H+-transporting ATPase subunit D
MQLLRLRRRLTIAFRGHKLLKDKRDELMRQFMELIKDIREIRERVESALEMAFKRFIHVSSSMPPERIEEALMFPGKRITLNTSTVNIMSVRVPQFTLEAEGDIRCYGYATTSGELDNSLLYIEEILSEMIYLAQKEKQMELLAEEIVRTRRRVNALEYILIPNLQETIRYITMKLNEMERSNLSRLMKVKDIVREKHR